MRAVVLFLALYTGLMILSFARAESFQTLNTVTLTNTGMDILQISMQDEDYIYYFTLSPVMAQKLSKTQLATPGWNGGPLAMINISISEAVVFGLLDEGTGLILLQGQFSTFLLATTNLSLLNVRVGEEFNSVTGFISEDDDGVSVANFISYATETNKAILQIRLDNPTIGNYTSSFGIPFTDSHTSSYSNGIAIVADFSSQFVMYNWATKDLLLSFKITEQSTLFTAYDSERNILYTCGVANKDNNYFAVLTRLNLSRIQNESTISFSLSSISRYYSSDAVVAQLVGEQESTCKGLVLHPTGQLVYALYHPPSSSGLVGRAIASTLDTIETISVDTSLSRKPVSLLIDDNKPLIYITTETEAMVVKLPTSFVCPLDCSSQGYCNVSTNYLCVCDAPYFGHNCEEPSPAPPTVVEQPFYEPIRILGQLFIPNNIGSVADEDHIYYITNCSVTLGKIRKFDIISSTITVLASNVTTAVIEDFGVSIPVVDPQVGIIYLIGATNCNNWDPYHTSKLVRVSTDDFTDHTVFDVPQIETAFLSYDRNGSYLNLFSWISSLRLKSSKTDNPLQTLSSFPDVSSPVASVFLAQTNTGIVVTEYATVHYDFITANTTHRYFLPYGFKAASLVADEERGKLYIVGRSWVTETLYLVVLTPALIPPNTYISLNETNYAKWIDLNYPYTSRVTKLFLDFVAGQAIIVQETQILRINVLTHEIFDQVHVFSTKYLAYPVQSAHYEADTSILFVTTFAEAAAFYIPPPCPRNCSGNGHCVYGACECNSEFMGDLCGEVVPPIFVPVDPPVEEPFVTPIAQIASVAVSVVPTISLVATFIHGLSLFGAKVKI